MEDKANSMIGRNLLAIKVGAMLPKIFDLQENNLNIGSNSGSEKTSDSTVYVCTTISLSENSHTKAHHVRPRPRPRRSVLRTPILQLIIV